MNSQEIELKEKYIQRIMELKTEISRLTQQYFETGIWTPHIEHKRHLYRQLSKEYQRKYNHRIYV